MKALHTLLAFNRGMVSKYALARVDIRRTGLSAANQTNWMPRVLGSMMLRPGLGYLGSVKDDNAAVFVPFIFSATDTALIELTENVMRVWLDDAVITRPSVTAAVTNGGFDTNLSGWTDNDESGATSAWATGGYMSLIGTGVNSAIRDQQVTVTETGTEHALSVHVSRGTAMMSIGSTLGGGEYFSEVSLREGYHSIAFTPTGNFHIRLSNSNERTVLVDSVQVESAGAMAVTTPWGADDLVNIRDSQSADVIFTACQNVQQYRVERQASRSWSVVKYSPEDGPFRSVNAGPTRLTASGLTGDITLTANKDTFRSTNVGGLYRLTSSGQQVEADLVAEDTYSDYIRVTGVGSSQRQFSIVRSGSWSGTLTLQRSVSEPGSWVDVKTYTTNGTDNYNDGLDNQINYYRVGFKTGDYTSGTAELDISYTAGSITGIVRVTAYTDAQTVSASVLKALGGTDSTDDWAEGQWSDRRGYPTAVDINEGRLWWAGKDKIAGSVSDAYSSFDEEVEGDSGPINRSIGAGPVENIHWLVSASHLLAGSEGNELVVRSSSLDEPVTPSNFNLKAVETQGSTNMQAELVGTSVMFVQRNGRRVYEMQFDGTSYNYAVNDLTAIIPEIGEPSIIRSAVQRQPDTRIHYVRSDGKVAVLVYDRLENVTCWILIETDGLVEDVVVLPGTTEDDVYYLVNRTINGATKRYLEKWAYEEECRGGETNKLVDSFYEYNGASTTTITGLDHLEGETVAVWGNTKDLGTYTVSSGQITLTEAVTKAFIGLVYTADFESSKMAVALATAANPTPLTQKQRIDHLGLVLADTHHDGIWYGDSFDTLEGLPAVEGGKEVVEGTIHDQIDLESFTLDGKWSTDQRLCMRAVAPKPATVLAAVVGISGHNKY